MVASLKFYTDSGKSIEAAAADLSDAKVVVYEDGNDNKYTLYASSINGLTKIDDIKLSTLKDVVFKYQLKGDSSETTPTGLGSIIGSLFATQSVQNGKTILAEEVAKQPVVDVLVPALATIGTDDTKKVYTKDTADTSFVKTDGTNATEAGVNAMLGTLTDKVVKTTELSAKAAEKAVVEAIFDAKDGSDKISETKIGATFAKFDGSNATEAGVNAMLDKLTDKVLKTSELKTKAAEKDVVDAITASADFTNKVYTKTAADTAFVKATELSTKAAEKSVVDAITASADFTNKVYTKTDADNAFVKVDGTNLDNAKVTDILEKLTDKVVKTTELPAKVAEKAVVTALVPALAAGAGDNGVYTKTAADTAFAKINASNLTDAANQKAFAEAILPAKDGQKSILVEKLGVLLDSTDSPYGASQNQAAKAFLAEKGLKPTPQEVATELMKNPNFTQPAAIEANVNDEGFQSAVRGVMSQPSFEIPTDPTVALSWDW